MAEYIGIKRDISGQHQVSEGSHSETLIFRADSENLFDQYSEILQHEKCPQPGVTFHDFFTEFVCRSIDPKLDDRTHNIWYVRADYSVGGEGTLSQSKSPKPQWGDPPERWYPTLTSGGEIRYVNADAAKTKLKPANRLTGISAGDYGYIVNGADAEVFYLPVDLGVGLGGHFTAAGEVYVSPGVQVAEYIDLFEITRYEKEFFIPQLVSGTGTGGIPAMYRNVQVSWPEYKFYYKGTVNAGVWYRHPRRTALLEDMQATTVWHGSAPYNRVTYRFRVDLNYPGRDIYASEADQTANGGLAMTSSHDPMMLHAGYKQIDGGKIKRILDADGSPLPTQTPVAPLNDWPCLNDASVSSSYVLERGQAYPDDAWSHAVTNGKVFVFPYVCYRYREERDFNRLNFDLDRFFPTMFAS